MKMTLSTISLISLRVMAEQILKMVSHRRSIQAFTPAWEVKIHQENYRSSFNRNTFN
jgi:hypothetical protein